MAHLMTEQIHQMKRKLRKIVILGKIKKKKQHNKLQCSVYYSLLQRTDFQTDSTRRLITFHILEWVVLNFY